jgi:Glycosyl transferases group 1
MRILLWHVHGAWTTSFVHGRHDYLIPALPGRGPDGRGRARTYSWPPRAVEVTPAQAAEADVDVVVLQRPRELHGLAERWLGGRRPGRDLPAVYVEHNAPQGGINDLRHVTAGLTGLPALTVVHVTHFNDLFWDTGHTRAVVIEHGIVDPGERYTGELPRVVAAVNEPARRGRVTGTDLLDRFGSVAPVDLFGMGTEALSDGVRVTGLGDLAHERLHEEMARRRVYLHPVRWTSLGLALLEAMHLGLPVVALATTEVVRAVPAEAGAISTDVELLVEETRRLIAEPERARLAGKRARAAALSRYGLDRFLNEWDRLLGEVRR